MNHVKSLFAAALISTLAVASFAQTPAPAKDGGKATAAAATAPADAASKPAAPVKKHAAKKVKKAAPAMKAEAPAAAASAAK